MLYLSGLMVGDLGRQGAAAATFAASLFLVLVVFGCDRKDARPGCPHQGPLGDFLD